MSTPEQTAPSTEKPKQGRRRLLLLGGGAALIFIASVAGLILWTGSAGFENLVRKRLIAQIEAATGGRVEIASFHWHLFGLDAEASGVVIHGRETASEAPYAKVGRVHVAISVLGFLSPRILLRDLEITQPVFHLIVYPDGSTNQPRPSRPHKASKSGIDTFFDLRAGHVAVEQGVLDCENRAADFDFQDRHLRLDFAANDVSALISHVGAHDKIPESFRIEAGARDLEVTRGDAAHPASQRAEGFAQATLDLTRNAAYLRSLRLTSRSKDTEDQTLEVSGSLIDFARPRWQATTRGVLDMRLLEPSTGYPNSPDGMARLDLAGEGHDGQFRIDGSVHVDGGSYIAPGVNARGVGLDAHVHADAEQLLITSIVARLRQGGQLEGTVALDHWLPVIPGTPVLEAATTAAPVNKWRLGRKQQLAPQPVQKPLHPAPLPIPVNGTVTAQLRDVSADTILDIVGQRPFQRLGIDARLNGPATATWSNGDTRTVAVSAKLNLSPSSKIPAGEAPATGTIDATYTQRDGAVDLRELDVALPGSRIEAHGHLGAYPVSSPTAISVDFRSHDLGEFDTVLRDLGLKREGKAGTAALPVFLRGKAEFHGNWSGSLRDPYLAGNLDATDLTVELPANPKDASGMPQLVHWDGLAATGSYSATRISIDRSELKHGQATIHMDGSLTASPLLPHEKRMPNFDLNSELHLHLTAAEVGMGEILPFFGESLPLSGQLSAQIEADGPIHALDGTGWIELNKGVVYGEPFSRIRAQGKVVGREIQLASITANNEAGQISGSGNFALDSHQFKLVAQGNGVDVGKIRQFQQAGLAAEGKLEFSVTGSGTLADPHLQAQGDISGLVLEGEPIGDLQIAAHTAGRDLFYDLATHFQSASLTAHGQTALNGEYATQARLEFSEFNIEGLLKAAHVPGLTGQSALAGTVTVEGPLAKPDQLHGEARLQNLAVTLVGVHLASDGPVHATLAGSRVNLDPIHITGEETDLHAQGSIDFKANKRVDFAANGSINLKLAETLDPDLTANGTTTFQMEAHGPFSNPGLRGRIDFQNASIALEDLPNSLSQLHGTLEFNQNRLEVRSLTAMTGGGQLSISGYLAYQHGIFADLSVSGKGVRIRYPEGVSSLADADLHLQGTQNNLLLSGGVTVTRFTVSPDLDIAALATQASKFQPVAPPDAPSNHVRLDVHIQSSPQLNFQNAYAKLAGDVDLRLRGTLAAPSVLGRVSITEGNATIAGTRYELQRGDITFTNPVRIEPSIDLNATARVEDYDITLGLHGSLSKMTVSYRSDPPLPEADVVALLALGRTESAQQIYGQQQEQVAANPTTEALLGGALNATVSSRVQKLFGAGSVKLDPNYLGVLGNSTTRITVEEQLSKYVTLTYATDVNTTAQQLIQAEIAINRHVSLLVARDESGVFSMVLKAVRRYR
ncbi:MAG: translocation/assembly module TamB domain-containing protein [Terracidiphilus sp.]